MTDENTNNDMPETTPGEGTEEMPTTEPAPEPTSTPEGEEEAPGSDEETPAAM